jgi:hypothetical protein
MRDLSNFPSSNVFPSIFIFPIYDSAFPVDVMMLPLGSSTWMILFELVSEMLSRSSYLNSVSVVPVSAIPFFFFSLLFVSGSLYLAELDIVILFVLM